MRADSPGVVIPPPLWFVAAFVAGLGLHRLAPLSFPHEAAVRGVSVALVLVALGLAGSAFVTMRAARTGILPFHSATALVRGGPFRFTRNPMYIALSCVYLAIALWFGLLWPMLLLPAALLCITQLVIRAEEAYLTRRFGDEYRSYTAQVHRWL